MSFYIATVRGGFQNNMNKRAELEKFFWLKFLLIGLGTLGGAAYGAYDAFVAGPDRLKQAKIWEPILLDESLSEEVKMNQWKEAAAEHGWKKSRPKKEIKIKSAKEFIWFNYGFTGLCLLISLPCLFWCLSTKGSWIESTENGLRNSAGKQLTLDQITKVDKAKWEKKGITVVHYSNDQGGISTFRIDDLKFERAKVDEIMAWVEDNIDSKLVVNGLLESQLATKKAEENTAENQPPQDG